MKASPYTYRVLRYLHDPATGEGLNVGILVYAPQLRWLRASFNLNIGRLKNAFPSLDGDVHRALMHRLRSRSECASQKCSDELSFGDSPTDLIGWTNTILREDDSSLQWGLQGGGLTVDPKRELDELYERMVARHQVPSRRQGRDDNAIWSLYKNSLKKTGAAELLTRHEVKTDLGKMKFDHAWKNGSWHCLQPLSLDLLDSDSIRNKGYRVVGEVSAVQDALKNHEIYFLLGEPRNGDTRKAAESTLNLLHARLNVKYELVREAEADAFSGRLSRNILEHGPHLSKL